MSKLPWRKWLRDPLLLAWLLLSLLVGAGVATHVAATSSHHASPVARVPDVLTGPAAAACPQAAAGHGQMGGCAPKHKLGLTAPRAVGGPVYPDRSNNDPCYCGSAIRAAGQVGLIVKANQGTGFIDSTAVGMIASARAAGLAVGEYDFDQDYTVAEAQVFVARLHAAGIYPSTPNTFPAYFDVEYGNFSYGGLLAQIAYVRAQGYRVGIYTGQWYWGPHAGCRWPSGLSSAWLSGYPNAPVPCGTTGFNAHQFTSTPIDLSVYLGSLDQFHAFVNAGPVGPSPALTRSRIAARGSSLHAYYVHHCRQPVLTSGTCGQLAWRVDHFQKLVDLAHGYFPHCFGKHADPHAAECQIVRPAVAVWSRARSSTASAGFRQGCQGIATWGLPKSSRACKALGRRYAYFDHRADRTVSTSRY